MADDSSWPVILASSLHHWAFVGTAAVCRIEPFAVADTAGSEVAGVGIGALGAVDHIGVVWEAIAEIAGEVVVAGSLAGEDREMVPAVDQPCVPFVELG